MKASQDKKESTDFNHVNLGMLTAGIALGLVDGQTLNALIDIAKMQLQLYKNFIGIGCTPKEATDQTVIFMTAVMRANKKEDK